MHVLIQKQRQASIMVSPVNITLLEGHRQGSKWKIEKTCKEEKGEAFKDWIWSTIKLLDRAVLSWELKHRDLHLPVTRRDFQLLAKKNLSVQQMHCSKLHLGGPADSWDAIR